ncbi:MAG: inverse autotransporter beta domain-containing protein [Alphaproteobacteria bacterium]
MQRKIWFAGCVLTISIFVHIVSAVAWENDKTPGWLNRTNLVFDMGETNMDAIWSIETVQPLLQSRYSKRNTIFFQGRAANAETNADEVYNLGLGYRRLFARNKWIFGTNVFYDKSFELTHQRYGYGLELIGEQIALRGNQYNVGSSWETVMDEGVEMRERAVDGWDAEIEGSFPYMPWLQIAFKKYKWDSTFSDDIEGTSLGFIGQITDTARLEFSSADDNISKDLFLRVRIALGKPESVKYTALNRFTAPYMFLPKDLSLHVLDPVKRNNSIVVERVLPGTATPKSTIIIGRRN